MRRGLADASIVRLLLISLRTGRSRGSGARKTGALGFGGGGAALLSYGGGASTAGLSGSRTVFSDIITGRKRYGQLYPKRSTV